MDNLIFSKQQIDRFLVEAPNQEYLANKVIIFFGIFGGLQNKELMAIQIITMELLNEKWIVHVFGKKNTQFILTEQQKIIVDAYLLLRPENSTINKFFLKYKNNRCFNKSIEKSYYAKIPKRVAEYLHLPNPNNYRSKALIKTGAYILSNGLITSADLQNLGTHDQNTVNNYLNN